MWGQRLGCHAPVHALQSLTAFRRSNGVQAAYAGTASTGSRSNSSSSRSSSSTAPRDGNRGSYRSDSYKGKTDGRGNSERADSSTRWTGPRHKSSGSSSNSSRRIERTPATPPPPRARDILLKPRRNEAAAAAGLEEATGGSRGPRSSSAALAVLPALGSSGDIAADPTYVPRDPKVQDGPWSAVDKQLVITAQQDAEQQACLSQAALPNTPQQQQQQQQHPSGVGDPQATAINPQGFVLLSKTAEQLSVLAQQLGQPKYRGKQVLESILRGCRNVLDLHGLPKAFREQLSQSGVVTGRSVVHHTVRSPDGTQKLLLQLQEGRVVETVGIPVTEESGKQRLTVCVSSQVGCPMRCTFCATGKGGFARNLQAHEIVDQVMTIGETFQQRPTNVVFMGMGEPLLNIPAVVAAATYMREQMGMSGRAITISTVGVPNAMRKLAQYQLTATLAVSIHAPNQELREQLIPSAKVYPLETLMSDCRDYFKATGRRVTFEYTLMGGTNDSTVHAKQLADLLRAYDLMSHVNLIPWNPVDESPYKRPGKAQVSAFKETLEKAGIPVSVRTTRGLEAAAACGQLRNQFQKAQLQDPKPLL